jgi:beta-phosphoglucomutase
MASAWRGIIFDMDGVLCDSEGFIREAAQHMFRQVYGVEVDDDAFRPFVGAGEDAYIGGPAAAAGIDIDIVRDKAETYRIYLEIIRGRLQSLPGVTDFVADARGAGLALAVCSAADRIKVEGNLAEIGLDPAGFACVLSGSEVARKKPDPEGFLRTAATMELPPVACLVVEDAVNGVRAAKAAGAACLALTTSFPAAELRHAGADWIVADLSAVPPELRQQLGLR